MKYTTCSNVEKHKHLYLVIILTCDLLYRVRVQYVVQNTLDCSTNTYTACWSNIQHVSNYGAAVSIVLNEFLQSIELNVTITKVIGKWKWCELFGRIWSSISTMCCQINWRKYTTTDGKLILASYSTFINMLHYQLQA